MTDLHTEIYGTGEPAVFVHGSGSWGEETFGAQRALADEFRVILIDRCGYGQSPAVGPIGWPTDTGIVTDLLTGLGSAHLVGHSTGRFPKLAAVGAWDPAVHPQLAGPAASRQRRALAAGHRALARRINARLVTFRRSTHNPMIEEPEVFNALLRDTWRQAHDG